MISYHFTGLNCPIKEIVIIWLDQSGCTIYFRFYLMPGVKFGGRIALAGRQFYQRFLVLQLGGLIFFKHVICNKQIIQLLYGLFCMLAVLGLYVQLFFYCQNIAMSTLLLRFNCRFLFHMCKVFKSYSFWCCSSPNMH